ncbi:MAG: hypothetical protein R3A52_17505 [Polyangiales bacterium]
MTLARALAALTVASGVALAGCEEPGPAPPDLWRFTAPQVVIQRAAESFQRVVLVEGDAARTFAVLTVTSTDGMASLMVLERVGLAWSAPTLWPRPAGITTESIEWAASAPFPAVITRGEGPLGTALYLRVFSDNAWQAPFQVTSPGIEAPTVARIAAGPSRLHLVYGVPGGSCADGVQLRYRETDADWRRGFGAFRFVASTCGFDSVGLAATPMAVDGGEARSAVMVVWTGPAPGLEDPQVWASWSAGDGPAAFRPPFRVRSGKNSGVLVAPMEGGRFLATWLQPRSEGGQQRAVASEFSTARDLWEIPNTGWFFTNLQPFPAQAPTGGALALGSEYDAVSSRLAARHYTSPAVPVASQTIIGTPFGRVSSHWLMVDSLGVAQAAWIESLDSGIGRVMHTTGVPVAQGQRDR